MKLKKIIAALLALTLCAVVFAACSSDKPQTDQPTQSADVLPDDAEPTSPESITVQAIDTVSNNEELQAVTGRDVLLPDGAEDVVYFPASMNGEGAKVMASASFSLNGFSYDLTAAKTGTAMLSDDGDLLLSEPLVPTATEEVPGDVPAKLFSYEGDSAGTTYSATFEADGCYYSLKANSLPTVYENADAGTDDALTKEAFLEVLQVFTEQAAA
ncbi:MAG: hypothetical protein IJK40_07050 [Clostridia bacterium]|nr:hypothetical protein [Clostridia bacterium]MBR0537889.1 hypothetical protein [Clostridia bacterium]